MLSNNCIKSFDHNQLENNFNNKKPLVSVCITAFNVDEYIDKCIDSILKQEVDFDYEIVIGEDFSRDNTREILKGYEIKYPEKLRVIYNERNLGMMPNFINTIESAKGQFIAIMDGDDIWINNKKLKSQVDFLLMNCDFSLCFHDAIICDKDLSKIIKYSEKYSKRFLHYNKHNTLEDIIKWRGILSGTSTIVFRKSFDRFPKWTMHLGGLESMIFILMLKYGKYHYIDETMSIYRSYSYSTDKSLSKINKALRDIKDYYIYYTEFYPVCRLFLIKKILKNRFYIIYQGVKNKEWDHVKVCFIKLFSEVPMYSYESILNKLKK
jgi:glycosyltransferase involved in cell wall biosynthesis